MGNAAETSTGASTPEAETTSASASKAAKETGTGASSPESSPGKGNAAETGMGPATETGTGTNGPEASELPAGHNFTPQQDPNSPGNKTPRSVHLQEENGVERANQAPKPKPEAPSAGSRDDRTTGVEADSSSDSLPGRQQQSNAQPDPNSPGVDAQELKSSASHGAETSRRELDNNGNDIQKSATSGAAAQPQATTGAETTGGSKEANAGASAEAETEATGGSGRGSTANAEVSSNLRNEKSQSEGLELNTGGLDLSGSSDTEAREKLQESLDNNPFSSNKQQGTEAETTGSSGLGNKEANAEVSGTEESKEPGASAGSNGSENVEESKHQQPGSPGPLNDIREPITHGSMINGDEKTEYLGGKPELSQTHKDPVKNGPGGDKYEMAVGESTNRSNSQDIGAAASGGEARDTGAAAGGGSPSHASTPASKAAGDNPPSRETGGDSPEATREAKTRANTNGTSRENEAGEQINRQNARTVSNEGSKNLNQAQQKPNQGTEPNQDKINEINKNAKSTLDTQPKEGEGLSSEQKKRLQKADKKLDNPEKKPKAKKSKEQAEGIMGTLEDTSSQASISSRGSGKNSYKSKNNGRGKKKESSAKIT
jgi:hypothetical protein